MKWFNMSDTVNLLSIIAAFCLVAATFFVVGIYIKKMKTDKSSGELIDGDADGIREYNNPLPIGWAVSYVVFLIWAVWYFLAGYPLNSYSQIGAYNEEVRNYNAKFESVFSNPSQETLLAMGKGIFLVECASCHGITGSGLNGKAADLAGSWGAEQGILDNIKSGSKGLNYPLGEMTPELVVGEDALAVAAYMASEISAIGKTANPNLVEKGKELWYNCSSCHGDDGKGMDGMAPDLTKYGSSEFVVDVLNRGKAGFIGEMPKFSERLSDVQRQAVGEYLISISQN